MAGRSLILGWLAFVRLAHCGQGNNTTRARHRPWDGAEAHLWPDTVDVTSPRRALSPRPSSSSPSLSSTVVGYRCWYVCPWHTHTHTHTHSRTQTPSHCDDWRLCYRRPLPNYRPLDGVVIISQQLRGKQSVVASRPSSRPHIKLKRTPILFFNPTFISWRHQTAPSAAAWPATSHLSGWRSR